MYDVEETFSLKSEFDFKKYSLHSKLVFATNFVLFFGGALLFMIFEDKNGKTLMALHAPNGIYRNEKGEEIKYEHLHLFPIIEKDGTILIEQYVL